MFAQEIKTIVKLKQTKLSLKWIKKKRKHELSLCDY